MLLLRLPVALNRALPLETMSWRLGLFLLATLAVVLWVVFFQEYAWPFL